ncbi:ExeM/NucH family extracellular endonuclease [Brevibacterium salitolerans]|uniref:Gram-positive cocci surface proteins LPxTG domain-containing protein n=1 Tax=Brevibacterium salitolerans TaxID=1403566 RepID=A0ABN2WQY1_9MICO
MTSPSRPLPLLAGAVTAALVTGPLLLPLTAHAADAPEISEIAYAGGDDTDFIEIAAEPGTDLSGWTVGSVTRGGTPQSAAHVVTVAEGTEVGDSGALAVRVPITNSVSSGSAADGSYGSSAFAVDADGSLVGFEQVGGVTGGKGVTAGGGSLLPEAVQGQEATPTGAVSARGETLQRVDGSWTSAPGTPDRLPGAGEPDPDPVEPGETLTIEEVQGTGETSPYTGQTVTTTGVVTAVYADGGLNGYTLQTSGTGADHELGGASSGIFVYSPQTAGTVAVGDSAVVTGEVSEYYGQTQITVAAGGLQQGGPAEAPVPFEGAFPEDEGERESLESMLMLPTGDITVTDTYSTNAYGEVGLVNGDEPLRQATDVVAPGAEAQAFEAENQAREFVLDDGASVNYTQGASDVPVAYVSTEDPVRVGAAATFTDPVVVAYGRDRWRLQPTEWLTGADADTVQPVEFADTREAAPREVGGDLTLSSFNVLNYFPTTGDQLSGCTFYEDREGNPITVRGGCDARGAATQESFERQQAKIVAAINGLDASVLSLEEIERSSAFGKDRDEALSILVDALNADAGAGTWDFVPSPEGLPEAEDVIRTAFIYQPAEVTPVGDSEILTDSPAFSNAREPLAQAWAPASDAGGATRGATAADGGSAAEDDGTFVTIVNHFKSKGSGSGEGNVDNGDGQGSSNADRVRQAEALVEFADAQAERAGTEDVALLGDFNSYTEEDPMQVLYGAGYANVGKEHTDEQTYLFGGRVGSLDHVLTSASLSADVAGADVWNINSVESIGLEYSRYNTNVTDLYAPDAFRSSDHDPLLVGLHRGGEDGPGEEPTGEPTGGPGEEPTDGPTGEPTDGPSDGPGQEPTGEPTEGPGEEPTEAPGDGQGDEDGSGDNGNGNGNDRDDNGQGDTGRGDDSRLPRTGAGLGALGAGLALLSAGVAAVIIARRRAQ